MPRPYKVICISTYVDDLAELDAAVAELKARGLKVSRSGLIRTAVKQLDLDKVGKGDLS